MSKFQNKILIVFIILINIFSINLFATDLIPVVETNEKIYDFANVFNTDDEKTIYDRIVSSISSYNIDIIIVTIEDNPYSTSKEYAKEFFIQNNFGFSSSYDGIIYLIDFDKLDTAVYANGKVNIFFTPEICDRINNSIKNYYLNENYTTSAFTFLNNITAYGSNISKYNTDFDTTKKIYDYANLLSASEESKLYDLATEYIDKTNYDMVIVTIDDNPKNNAMKYADDFYDYNCFGLDADFSGILFLIDMDTREMWISTTGKCINEYSDYEIDKILDYTYDEISDKDYFGCAKIFIEKADYYKGTSNISSSNSNNKNHYYNDDYAYDYDDESELSGTTIVVVTIIVTGLFIAIATSKHKTAKIATQANAYAKNFRITDREDRYIRKHTSKVYDPPSESSSSGGGSSFSSSHRSSSGRSHGGGGRRF